MSKPLVYGYPDGRLLGNKVTRFQKWAPDNVLV